MASYGSNALETLGEEGQVPDTRMKDARACQDFFRRMRDNDQKRSWKRARINGLVDGNPPYERAKLLKAGRADACNVNFGNARSYLESASGSFYDLTTEAPGFFTFRTTHGSPEEQEKWSNEASREADQVLQKAKTWDYDMQLSQWDMTLHGCGPFMFEDAYGILPRATACGDLFVPERSKSETDYWECCAVQVMYYPPELYKFIENAEAAGKVGWNVEYTKRVIANAMDIMAQQGIQYDWEFYQQQLKNNSLTYYDDTKVCWCVHMFWKEFDGRITHAIVERETSVGDGPSLKPQQPTNTDIKYLFVHVGRYKSFNECVHPMYFDHGNGGYHHSVTGLGVKMYSLMEYENRLLCNLCDKAFSPKILFKPTTTEMSQKFEMTRLGDMAVLPAGYDAVQTGVAGLMNDGLAMHEQLQQMLQGTLGAYKTPVVEQKSGNPATKFEKQMQAAMQSALSKTQFNRYYIQWDYLAAEMWRRLSNPNTTDDRAKEFQKRCKDKGIPIEALNRVAYIGATRVVGQGSAFMRKQAIDSLFPIIGSFPEEGRDHLIADKIAAEAGQSAVNRYYPRKPQPMPDDQQSEALHFVAGMKVGIPAIVTSTQNAVVFAATYLKAASDALKSLQQGGHPVEVLQFVELAGPAMAAQLQRFANDPTRKPVHDALMKQWQQLAQAADQLKAHVQQQMEQKKAQQKKTQDAMTDGQLRTQKARLEMGIKSSKAKQQMQQSDEKHKLKVAHEVQDLQLADISATSEINRSRLKSLSE